MKTLPGLILKNPLVRQTNLSLETRFLCVMSLIIVFGLAQQLCLGYFREPLVTGKISQAKKQNLARAMESVERKRHRLLTGQGKSLTTPVK
jgi:hypothetical protein